MSADQSRSTSIPGRPVRKLLRWCAYLLAAVVLLGAGTLAGLRVLLPELDHYRPRIEAWLSGITDRKVELGAIDAHWRGWIPVFRIKDVRLAGDDGRRGAPAGPALRIAEIAFSIDPFALLRSGTLQPREITASGVSLVVVRRSDGSFAVQGLGGLDPTGREQSVRLASWISSQAEISLFTSRILWIDERYSLRPLSLDGVTLHVRNEGGRHRISGGFEPAGGGRIDFAVDVAGDSPPASWSGAAYVAAHDVDITRSGLDLGQPETEGLSGVVSAAVWSTWRNGRPVEADGTFRVRSPGVVYQGRRRGVDEASASFKVERTREGWTLVAHDLVVTTSNGPWPASRVGATWRPPHDGRDGAMVVNAEYARIEDLVALLAPRPEPSSGSILNLNTLIDAAPHGAIEDLRFSAPVTDRVEIEHASATGRITGLRIGEDAGPVVIDSANGHFEAGAQGMVADVTAGRLRVSTPDWLARPLRGEKLAGTVAVVSTPEGIRARVDGASLSTPTGAIAAEGWMLVPRDESEPEVSATLSLDASQIAAAHDLIMGRALPEPVSRWIEAAAPFGDVREARLTFRGRLSGKPSSAGGGTLEATARFSVPLLDYAPGWPEITGLSAVARFDGRRLEARVESGRILTSDIREGMVTIEDVSAETPVARVEGRIEGASANAVRFLAESPLRAGLPPLIDTFAIHGDSTVELELTVPLKGGRQPIAADGRITLDRNRIDLPGLHRGLTRVNGTIAFEGATVTTDGITATWLGEPIHVVIGPSPDVLDATRLSIGGRLDQRLLAIWLHDAGFLEAPNPERSPLLARVRGDTAWHATVDIPRTGDGQPTSLYVSSDLTGLSLDLPPPFGKASGTARTLSIDSRTTPGVEHVTEIRHGDLASAALRLVRDTDRFRFDRGAVRLGGGPVTLPDTPGVIVRGAVPELDTGAWRALLEDIAALRTPEADASGLGHTVEVSIEADIEADSVTALGAQFPETHLLAARGADGGWRLELDGRHLKGTVDIPRDPGAESVTMDFERFELEPGSAETASEPSPLDPRTLPAWSFSTRSFVLSGYDLGQVRFTATPSEQGLALDGIEVQADAFKVEGRGRWSLTGTDHPAEFQCRHLPEEVRWPLTGTGHRTELDMRIFDADLGRTLVSLGFDGSAVAEGATEIGLCGSWTGAPTDFALERLAGIMHFQSTGGRLPRVERGVTGRVFGLLTVTSLPRRLILDFSDLFKDGFEYDRIAGSFALENGNAYTSDLSMESDTALFEVVGRTGLVSEDYDQLITVIPKISSALPLIPIWLAQKILDRKVFDKAFAYQYTITGPWDEPAVELVKTESRESRAQQ